MKTRPLSEAARRAAQRRFFLFMTFNVVSFQFLSGNIITLYALRLGAGTALVGLLFSFVPVAQLLPLVGRPIVARYGTVRTMATFWLIRYVTMVPALFAPLLVTDSSTSGAIGLIAVGVLGFNLARGIGMTGHNNLVGGITTEQDRGSFLSRFQLVVHAISIVTGLVIAFLLGQETPLYVYTVLIGVGIASGLAASAVLVRLPEPRSTAPGRTGTFLRNFRGALQRRGFRVFVGVLLAAFATTYMVQPFLVVFFKQVYAQGDNTVAMLLVVGSVGAIIMALLTGLLVDRMGAKPLIGIFSGVVALTLIPLAIAPPLSSPTAAFVFGSIVFLFYTMGFSGISSTTNIYFFSIIREDERLDMGVVYFLCTGGAATAGALLGGALLEWLTVALGQSAAFRWYFAALVALTGLVIVISRQLDRLGSSRIRDVLSVFFSIRDLRTLGLLNRLSQEQNAEREQSLISELGTARSGLSRRELLARMHSPRFAVRREALNALRDLRNHPDIEQAVVSEIRRHQYTTAYLAADIAGLRGMKSTAPALTEALESKDYFLVSKAMVSLARLGHTESIATIEAILGSTSNPRIIIHAATALEILRSATSVPALIAKLERRFQPYVRDEIILAIAGIMGFGEYFYRAYSSFLQKGSTGAAELAGVASGKREAEKIDGLLDAMSNDRAAFCATARELLGMFKITVRDHDLATDLRLALDDAALVRLDRFRFLVAAAIAWFMPHASNRGGRRRRGTTTRGNRGEPAGGGTERGTDGDGAGGGQATTTRAARGENER